MNFQDLAVVQAAHLRISLKHDRRAHERLVCNLHIGLAKSSGAALLARVLLILYFSMWAYAEKNPQLQRALSNVAAKHSLYIHSPTTVEKHLLHLLFGRVVSGSKF